MKSFPLVRNTRATGMGAYDNSYLYSIKQKKELSPHRTTSSRTGNHGSKTWFLLPGIYIEVWIVKSNTGKGNWHIDYLSVDENGEEDRQPVAEEIEWLKPLVEDHIWSSVFFQPHE